MSTQTWFSPSAARSVLARGPLVFGDLTAIAAHRYLQDLHAARAIIGQCEHGRCLACRGSGSAPYGRKATGGELCDCCDGTGTGASCNCFAGMNGWAVRDARAALRKGENP
jgi:hypothetical protein